WTPITPENKGVNAGLFPAVSPAFALSSDGLMLAVVYDRGDDDEIEVYDVGTMKARPLPALPPGQISRLAWRPGSRELGFTLASLQSPGDVYSIDTAIGTLSRWTESETSGFNPAVLPPPEVIKWKSKDGMTISGILYRPPSGKFTGPRPVMVNIHGGPNQRERARFIGRSNYFLNDLGIALIYPNVRGSIGFGPQFEKADDGRGRKGAIEDIGALLDWIGAHPEFDKNRVMLTGASYGGWLSLEAGIVYGDRVRCIFEGAGITDFVTFMEQTDPSRLVDRRAEYGDERDPDTRAFLESISPLTRSADLKVPTFVAAGARDSRVPVAQARQLVEALKGRNVPVWYTEYADAGHDGFPNSLKNYDFLFNTWAMFIKQYLLN
ncbi:MAG TPA: prolyl oligopeptidase family serine peptidase, partial [Vicinamibacterales bacterium]|nr:prolyl oligopeptidase family serine peptidase [Vicinamibacterales bacterium]